MGNNLNPSRFVYNLIQNNKEVVYKRLSLLYNELRKERLYGGIDDVNTLHAFNADGKI